MNSQQLLEGTIRTSVELLTFKTKLETLDLEPIKFKLIFEEGWTLLEADQVEILYKRYLLLTYKFPKQSIVPTKQIDKFWHNHILDTEKYQTDCSDLFGYFLHHFPYFGLQGELDYKKFSEAFEVTKLLFISEFNETITGSKEIELASMCDGGGCDGTSCDTDGPPYRTQIKNRPDRNAILARLQVN